MKDLYKEIVKHEVFPALGCTEPIAVAYAVSVAVENITSKVNSIIVTLDQDTYKNAIWVEIPNSWSKKWINAAVSLWLFWDSKKSLEVLKNITQEEILMADEISKSWIIKTIIRDELGLFIWVDLNTDNENIRVVIEKQHTNITTLEVNWENKISRNWNESSLENQNESYQDVLKNMTLEDMISVAKNIDESDIEYIKKWILMQLEISKELESSFFTNFEKIKKSYSWPLYTKEISELLIKCTSATYARMSWVNKPVMSSWWSWNQWIVAMLLPYLYGTEILKLDKNDRVLYESIALSNIINSYVKCFTGSVSSMCWCSTAAWKWAIAAILYQQWFDDKIATWIDNMVASTAWILCDWAKIWCYNKVASSVVNVINSVSQSINSLWVSFTDWIIWKDSLESIRNVAKISNDAWITKTIIPILALK